MNTFALLACVAGGTPDADAIAALALAKAARERTVKVSEVAVRPFLSTSASGLVTPVRSAEWASTSNPVPARSAAVTTTNARWITLGGGTFRNCSPSG